MVNLINDLLNIPYNINKNLVSFNFNNVYTSIPTKEVLDIIQLMCDKNNADITLSQEILNTCRTISQQNYFSHNDTLYIQDGSLAMGASTLSLFFLI